MEPFGVAQSFIAHAVHAHSLHALAASFQEALHRLGFQYFACCSHVNPLRVPPHAVMLHNYPAYWVRIYGEKKFHEIDPVLLHAQRTLLPFSWDSPAFQAQLTAQQEQVLIQGAQFGIRSGYTIPIHQPWAPGALSASCSLVPDSTAIEPPSYLAAHLMATYLYDVAARAHQSVAESPTLLSLRERQCLELVAQGKSNWTIGEILRISEHTVHRHIESAKRRLGVATRVQAVVSALQRRQISCGDAVRAESYPG